jgi:hypothetical protein
MYNNMTAKSKRVGAGVTTSLEEPGRVLSDILHMLDGLLTWTAHSEYQEVWAGPSWSSYAFKVRSVLLPGSQDPFKSVLLHLVADTLQLLCADAVVTQRLPDSAGSKHASY